MVLLDSLPPGSGTFPTFASVSLIDSLGFFVLAIVVVGAIWKYVSWKRVSPPNFFTSVRSSVGSGTMVRVFFSELFNRVALQRDVINDDDLRRFTHLAMFWGFVGLSVTTTLDYIFNAPGNYISLTEGSLNPIRWLGNASGAVMVLGSAIAIGRLVIVQKYKRGRSFGDVWFTTLLFLAGITGFITEYLGDNAYNANPAAAPAAPYSLSFSASPLIVIPYGVHLVAIGLLLISAPISAFMHALTVPSLRYIDRLGSIVSTKNNLQLKNGYRRSKEQAMLDEVQNLYKGKDTSKEEND